MVDGKLLHRIVVWPTYEDAAAAEEAADSEDCKRDNRLTVWQTYEQAAAHTSIGGGGGDGGEVTFTGMTVTYQSNDVTYTPELWLFRGQRVTYDGDGVILDGE